MDNIGYYINDNKWIGTDYDGSSPIALRRLVAIRERHSEILIDTILDLIRNKIYIDNDSNYSVIRAKLSIDRSYLTEVLWDMIKYKIFNNKRNDIWFLHRDFTIVWDNKKEENDKK